MPRTTRYDLLAAFRFPLRSFHLHLHEVEEDRRLQETDGPREVLVHRAFGQQAQRGAPRFGRPGFVGPKGEGATFQVQIERSGLAQQLPFLLEGTPDGAVAEEEGLDEPAFSSLRFRRRVQEVVGEAFDQILGLKAGPFALVIPELPGELVVLADGDRSRTGAQEH